MLKFGRKKSHLEHKIRQREAGFDNPVSIIAWSQRVRFQKKLRKMRSIQKSRVSGRRTQLKLVRWKFI